MERRDFLRSAALTTGALTFGRGFWAAAYAAPARPGPGPYGALLGPDPNGMMLPDGFSSRVIAVSGQAVTGTSYVWHPNPDGAAIFPTADGGWIHAVNSETPAIGGVGAIRYGRDGSIVDAYRILTGTSQNCAGGQTPWGTWLSCEEYDFSDAGGPAGLVWECDPRTASQGIVRPALGAFSHEAVAVDPVWQRLYLTEDQSDGRLYRFTPAAYPSLDAGLLEVAVVAEDGATSWAEVPDPSARTAPTRRQVPESRAFDGGEGIWFDEGYVYFTTKGTNRVWVHDIAGERTTVLYDAGDHPEPPLTGVDNVVVAPSGDLVVAEDGGNLELVVITADSREVAPIMRLVGEEHAASEITGPVFSPDGSRLYFSSQRGGDGTGITYEVTGPFRTERVGIAALGATTREVPAPDEGADPAPTPPPSEPGRDEPAPAVGDREPLPSTGGGAGAAAIGVAAVAGAAALRRAGAGRSDDPSEAVVPRTPKEDDR